MTNAMPKHNMENENNNKKLYLCTYMKENSETISHILSVLKIETLNTMQEATIKAYEENKDIVLLSPTGSGKTLAYLLPLVRQLDASNNEVQALVLVPSRELALQTEQVFKSMGTKLRAMSCYGGRPAMEEHRTMNGVHPQVIVGTPGRMNDHLQKHNFDVHGIHTLIIDEFDKSLEFGFQDEMSQIIGQLPNLDKRILLSATDAEEIPLFTGMERTLKLNFLETNLYHYDRIRLHVVNSQEKDKLDALYKLLCVLGSQNSLVFVNYRESVDRVGRYLQDKGVYCEMFHGGMEQMDRERALYKFSNGSCNVFVSTDLASRGLDIPDIDNIIHYHLPVNEEAYIHRNGRTARWDAEGNSYIILNDAEQVPEYINENPDIFVFPDKLPKPSMPDWVTLYIGKGKKDKLNKVDVVGFLSKVGNLSKNELGRVDVKDHFAFAAIRRKKLKETLNLVKGEKIKGMKTIIEMTK